MESEEEEEMIAVSEFLIFSLILVIIFLIFGMLLFYLSIKKNAPEALMFMKARKKKLPLTFVHYPEGIIRPYIPKIERFSSEVSTPFFVVGEVGIKFRNPDGRKVERWNGEIPVHNYFVNMPEGVAIADAVAYSQLKDYLKTQDIDIDTIEDVAFYVLSEFERTGDINLALSSAKIENEETKQQLLAFLNFIENHREDIEKLKLKSGIFTFQTAIRALDATIAYTSSNVAHMKSVIEASIRRQLANATGDFMKYGLFIFLACLGVGALYIMIKGN